MAKEERSRTRTEIGEEYLTENINAYTNKLGRINENIDKQVVRFGMCSNPEEIENVRRELLQLETVYENNYTELLGLLERNPGEFSDETSVKTKANQAVVLMKVRSCLQKMDILLNSPEQNKSETGSSRSRSSTSSRAKIEAAKVKLAFAEKNAAITRKEAEVKAEKEILKRQEALAIAIAEFKVCVEEENENESLSDVLSEEDQTSEKKLNYEENQFVQPPQPTGDKSNNASKLNNQNNPVSEFAQYMIKKDLIMTRFNTFNDKPESFPVWQSSFNGIISELNLTDREELDLLTKYLGPRSQQQAQSIRIANPNDPKQAIKKIWSRLEERYGRPEMVESAVKTKLANFPKINNDFSKLYDLSDIVSEIESLKEDKQYSLFFSQFDTLTGVNQILQKLPHRLQQKWFDRATNYKKQHSVPYPPFSVFSNFMRDMSNQFNDPSFVQSLTTSTSHDTPKSYNARKSHESVTARKTVVHQTKPSPNLCVIHKKDYPLTECRVFQSKTMDEKMQ